MWGIMDSGCPLLSDTDMQQAVLPLRAPEIKLLLLMRALGHGILREVVVHDGLPVYVNQVEKKVKLA